jgi:hypothetical protein
MYLRKYLTIFYDSLRLFSRLIQLILQTTDQFTSHLITSNCTTTIAWVSKKAISAIAVRLKYEIRYNYY